MTPLLSYLWRQIQFHKHVLFSWILYKSKSCLCIIQCIHWFCCRVARTQWTWQLMEVCLLIFPTLSAKETKLNLQYTQRFDRLSICWFFLYPTSKIWNRSHFMVDWSNWSNVFLDRCSFPGVYHFLWLLWWRSSFIFGMCCSRKIRFYGREAWIS